MALTDDAILRIKQLIVTGRLHPGDRLPREADLAEQLGLSRSSLREAVRALSFVNILDVRQGDGTYVSSLRPDVLLDTLTFVVDLNRDDTVLDFLRVRRILEPEAAAMATLAAGTDDLAALRRVLDRASPDGSPEEMLAGDIEFHRLLALAAGNGVLASLLEALSGPTNRARIWRGRTETGAGERTLREHRAILDAMASRLPDVARAAMVVHVAGVESWLRRTADQVWEADGAANDDLSPAPAAPAPG